MTGLSGKCTNGSARRLKYPIFAVFAISKIIFCKNNASRNGKICLSRPLFSIPTSVGRKVGLFSHCKEREMAQNQGKCKQ